MSKGNKSGAKGRDAYQLFPDIMDKFSPTKAPPREAPPPPAPPDISWLKKGEFEPASWVADVPTAMLVMPEGESKALVAKAFKSLGYLVETPSSEEEAVERVKFANLTGIALQTGQQNNPLEKSVLHNHLRGLPMSRRRLIYYVLIGPGYQILYDLQALSLSANLVVNDGDIGKMDVILRKGLQDYESLFNPLLSVMREYGKK